MVRPAATPINRKVNIPSKETVMKPAVFDINFQIKIRIFQKCKVHLCILKGFKTAAHQSWHIFCIVQESNPSRAGHINFVGPGWIPRRREVCANFDELQF